LALYTEDGGQPTEYVGENTVSFYTFWKGKLLDL